MNTFFSFLHSCCLAQIMDREQSPDLSQDTDNETSDIDQTQAQPHSRFIIEEEEEEVEEHNEDDDMNVSESASGSDDDESDAEKETPRRTMRRPLRASEVSGVEWSVDEKKELFRLLGKYGRRGLMKAVATVDLEERRELQVQHETQLEKDEDMKMKMTAKKKKQMKMLKKKVGQTVDNFGLFLTKTPVQVHQYIAVLDAQAKLQRTTSNNPLAELKT